MKTCARLTGAVLTAGGLIFSAWGQTPPNAGSVLRELTLPPAPRPDAAPGVAAPPAVADPARPRSTRSFLLRSVRIDGASKLPTYNLLELVRDKVGTTVTLADLEVLADRVTAFYRGSGYLIAQAVVPAQDIGNGDVVISVFEGRLGQVQIEKAGDVPVPDKLVQAIVNKIPKGEPLRRDTVERAMLLLSDLPGTVAAGELEQGGAEGTSDLIVQLKPRAAVDASVDIDNHGSRSTGEYRIGGFLRWNSPLQLGDNLDLRYSQSLKTDLLFGRLSYELPLGSDGTRIGVGFARVRYELGGEFSALDAEGTATVWDLNLLHPLIRNRRQTVVGRLYLETRDLSDRVSGVTTDKRLNEIGSSLSFESRDDLWHGGYLNGVLGLRHTRLRFDDAAAAANDARRTQGGATRVVFQLSRLQTVNASNYLFAGLSGQWSNKNLDSAARLSLGGPGAVRGYAPSEGVVDEGAIATLEWRHQVEPTLTVFGFFDTGWGHVNASGGDTSGQSNTLVRRSAGVGTNWLAPYAVQVRGTLGWRGGNPPGNLGEDRRPRLYLQASKSF